MGIAEGKTGGGGSDDPFTKTESHAMREIAQNVTLSFVESGKCHQKKKRFLPKGCRFFSISNSQAIGCQLFDTI